MPFATLSSKKDSGHKIEPTLILPWGVANSRISLGEELGNNYQNFTGICSLSSCCIPSCSGRK